MTYQGVIVKLISIVLIIFSTLSVFGSTYKEQLIDIGFEQLSDSNFYSRGPFTIRLEEGLVPQFYEDLDNNINEDKIFGVRIGQMFSDTPCLETFHREEDGSAYAYCRVYGGSMGGSDLPDPLPDFVELPLEEQLLLAGFSNEGLGENVFSYEIEANSVLIVYVAGGEIQKVIKKADEDLQAKVTADIKFTDYKVIDEGTWDEDFHLILENSLMEMAIHGKYSFRAVGTKFLKNLDQIQLSQLLNEIPKSYKDDSGFLVGAMNTNKVIETLHSINGITIEEIEVLAREVQKCSDGTTFLGDNESIIDIMLSDNQSVVKQKTNHTDIALPLQYLYAIFKNSLPKEFVWKGKSFAVNFGLIPMCGSLKSPFGDDFRTSVVFPKVKNIKTGEEIEVSLLHAHLIQQYGFYGGNLESRKITPEKLNSFFNGTLEKK